MMHSSPNLLGTEKQACTPKAGFLTSGITDILGQTVFTVGCFEVTKCLGAPSLPCPGDKQMSPDTALGWVGLLVVIKLP